MGGVLLDDLTADEILLAASRQANRDPVVIALFRDWSACMSNEGFQYSSPLVAIGSSRWTAGKSASEAEIHTAVADVSCKDQLHMLPKWVSVESHYEQVLVAKDDRRLSQAIRAWDSADVQARALLADS